MVTDFLVAPCRILTQQQMCDCSSPYKTYCSAFGAGADFITYVGSRLGEVWKECSSVLAEDSSRRDGERVPQLGIEGCGAACRWQVIGGRPEREHYVSLRLMTRLVLPHRRFICLCLCACARACEWMNDRTHEAGRWEDGEEVVFREVGEWVEKDNKQAVSTQTLFFFFFYVQGARYLEVWDGKNGILHFSPTPALTPQHRVLIYKTKSTK